MMLWVGLQGVFVVFPDHTCFFNPEKFTHIFLNLFVTVRVVLPLVALEEASMVKSL